MQIILLKNKLNYFRLILKSLKLFNCYNYPNPFKRATQFSFEVTQNSDISLKIFSLAGRRVKVFIFIILKLDFILLIGMAEMRLVVKYLEVCIYIKLRLKTIIPNHPI